MFEATWRISEMELWDQDAIDLLGPGYFRFDDEQSGEFQFITRTEASAMRPGRSPSVGSTDSVRHPLAGTRFAR